MEAAYDVTRRVEWFTKLAARTQEETVSGLPSIRSRSYLAIQRLNLGIWKPIELGLEYRVLGQDEANDRRQGWLTEVMWSLHEHFRIGGGFNFTDFSDNEFSSNDYSVTGWFFRIQGRY
jgi:hypothetical protein